MFFVGRLIVLKLGSTSPFFNLFDFHDTGYVEWLKTGVALVANQFRSFLIKVFKNNK